MTRIYHPYWLWEDHKNGFYENCSGESKTEYTKKSIEMFSSEKLTREWMFYIVDNWRFSCEHNLTNPSLNQIDYIGQSACCAFSGCPSTVTMELWSKLPKEVRDRSDKIAQEAIDRWKEKNKYIQLCLNID